MASIRNYRADDATYSFTTHFMSAFALKFGLKNVVTKYKKSYKQKS